jgi:serine/alanine adding enzyme
MLKVVDRERPLRPDTVGFAAAGEWDDFVRSRSTGTFAHLYGWRPVMEELLGHEARYLAARDPSGAIAAVLPLVRVQSRLFGDYMVSMPFLNYGGPVGDPDAVEFLVQRASELARDAEVDLLELRARDELPGDLATSDRKITVLLDLPEDPDVLWNGFKSKVRSQVRRPLKEGMEVQINLDQVVPFYDIYCRHMRDLGTPVLPRAFFLRALHLFEDDIVFAAVYHEGRPVAAGAGFVHGDEFEITWASALRDYNRLAPNMLLYWSLMAEMSRRGLKTFNFGRCSRGSGTHKFKSQWGGRDHPLPWAQWSAAGVDATPNPDSPKFRLATRAWQRLPLALTNRMGPWLARNIP